MLLLIALIFYLTLAGANIPSQMLSEGFDSLGRLLEKAACSLSMPVWSRQLLLNGIYNTLSAVVSVMLPPMAIFFPLFTILEDLGYLPRVAFNLDCIFRRAGTNGRHAMPLLMGFGCNACGITGCRILETENERRIAALTNNFVPCNGRFPTITALISIFIIAAVPWIYAPAAGALVLMCAVILSVSVSLLVSRFLSRTFLKTGSHSFLMELPPFRRPQVIRILFRSVFDRTLRILFRAVIAAVPAGALIWVLANTCISGKPVISFLTSFLDSPARLIGLDGVILSGFLLGAPANEIVLPITLMIYSGTGSLADCSDISRMGELLINNGWTIKTAVCTILFSLMHFPCTTSMITFYKETKSLRWTAAAALIPTLCGIFCCMTVNLIFTLFF